MLNQNRAGTDAIFVIAAQKIKVAENPAYKDIDTKPEETEPQQISANETKATEMAEKNQPQNNMPTAQNSYLWLAASFIFGMILSYLLFAKRGEKMV